MKRINWIEVIVFTVLATAISAPFRLGVVTPQKLINLPNGLGLFFNVLRGVGPIAAFFIMFYVLKTKTPRPNTFFGTNVKASIIAIAVIPLGLAVVGVPNEQGLQTNYFGLVYGLMLVAYALCEEYGWRGYLQSALEPLNKPVRVLVIAVTWYVWHLNFLVEGIPLKTHVIHFAALVAGSWGLLQITNMTRSMLFASAVHLSFNIFSDVRSDFNGRLMVLLFAVLTWVVLIRLFFKVSKTSGADSISAKI